DEDFGLKTFNSRSETLQEKKAFAHSFKNKRCIIPMSGFYEWKKTQLRKIPYYIHLKNDILPVAAIYDHWKNNSDEIIKSFSIVTTDASDFIGPIHNRMPVILRPDQIDIWNSKDTSVEDLETCFTPYHDPNLKAYQVSSLVNHSKHNQPEVIRPLYKNEEGEPIYYDPETQDIEPQKSLEDFF
ncbi:MAG: SOS response-associated peptidase, partial [Candidatus Heimdallarchaeota archaeon]|nr:SOS response-associated peptidase [Candidatus Heimdallarchaeota archaeon]